MFEIKTIEKIKMHILCSVTFFFPNIVPFVILWKNVVKSDRQRMTLHTTAHAHCVLDK